MGSEERLLLVYWQRVEDPQKFVAEPGHVLYAIYGQHHMYGRQVLLYIGRSTDVGRRLGQHRGWIEDEYDDVEIRVASIVDFPGWKAWEADLDESPYDHPGDSTISGVETLLIYAHQPAYNSQNVGDAKLAKGMRIFNAGRPGPLLPEVSYRYHLAEDGTDAPLT